MTDLFRQLYRTHQPSSPGCVPAPPKEVGGCTGPVGGGPVGAETGGGCRDDVGGGGG